MSNLLTKTFFVFKAASVARFLNSSEEIIFGLSLSITKLQKQVLSEKKKERKRQKRSFVLTLKYLERPLSKHKKHLNFESKALKTFLNLLGLNLTPSLKQNKASFFIFIFSTATKKQPKTEPPFTQNPTVSFLGPFRPLFDYSIQFPPTPTPSLIPSHIFPLYF